MNCTLKIFIIILLLVLSILVYNTVKKEKLTMKYASFWIAIILLMLIVTLFPNSIFNLSELLGFEKASNMIFLIAFFFLTSIQFILTASLSVQNKKIVNLIQKISMLESKGVKESERKK